MKRGASCEAVACRGRRLGRIGESQAQPGCFRCSGEFGKAGLGAHRGVLGTSGKLHVQGDRTWEGLQGLLGELQKMCASKGSWRTCASKGS